MKQNYFMQSCALVLLTIAITLTLTPDARADPARVERNSRDARWVTDTVEVAAAPEVVLASLRAVMSWPRLFHDIVSLSVKTRTRGRQVLSVHSKILGDHAHEFTVADRGDGLDVLIDITGVVTRGTLSVSPGRDERSATATFSLYAETSGVAGLFVSERTLRAKQEALVRTYLTDLAKGTRP